MKAVHTQALNLLKHNNVCLLRIVTCYPCIALIPTVPAYFKDKINVPATHSYEMNDFHSFSFRRVWNVLLLSIYIEY